MTTVVGPPPIAGQCRSLLLLPPFEDENYLRCRRPAGHTHPTTQLLHTATDPSGTVRRWPESMAAKLARVTPLDQPKGTP